MRSHGSFDYAQDRRAQAYSFRMSSEEGERKIKRWAFSSGLLRIAREPINHFRGVLVGREDGIENFFYFSVANNQR